MATNAPAALDAWVSTNTGVQLALAEKVAATQDPVEQEYRKLLERDEAAMQEVDRWIQENRKFSEQGAGLEGATLAAKVEQRLKSVENAYEDFVQRHPNHVDARLAYGSFLNDQGREVDAVAQWKRASEIAPDNPAAWNNLAHYYGHRGPVKKAFECYAKAIEIDPKEPVYKWNLATTVYLFRKDAKEFYSITEQEVFDKAMRLYRDALKLDPENFVLASDLAMSYYGIRPWRFEEALEAWNNALKIAPDETSRQGVYIHLARIELNSGQFEEARKHLDLVTLPQLKELKERLERNLKQKREEMDKDLKGTSS